MNLLNFVSFQLGWFACVLGAAYGYPALGPILALPMLLLHLATVARHEWRGELRFVLMAAALGILMDSLMGGAGVMRWLEEGQPAFLCPPWLLALWFLFPTSVGYSMGWLHGRLKWAALVGLVGGPLAYYAGGQLGAVAMPGSLGLWPAFIIMGMAWAIFFPALYPLRAWALRVDQ